MSKPPADRDRKPARRLQSERREDARETREFLGYLRDEVSAGMAAGQSLDELKQTLKLERYRD